MGGERSAVLSAGLCAMGPAANRVVIVPYRRSRNDA
jgi:hypothetical protein